MCIRDSVGGDADQCGAVGAACPGAEAFEDEVEGDVPVLLGFEERVAHAAQQPAEGRGAGEVHPYGQGVDAEADQAAHGRAAAVGARHADDEVVVAGEAVQCGEGRGERHREERGLPLCAQCPQGVGHGGREGYGAYGRGAHGGVRGGRRRRWQAGRFGVGQQLAPALQLLLEAGQGLVLAARVVGVLRRRGEGVAGRSAGGRRVEVGEFAGDGLQGGAVHGDVVERQQHGVVLRAVAQDERPYGVAGREVERPGRLAPQQLGGLRLVGVDDVYGDRPRGREHLLAGLAVVLGVAGAQDGVPGHQGGEGGGERGHVERAAHPGGERYVVRVARAAEPLHQPHAALRAGEGDALGGPVAPGPRCAVVPAGARAGGGFGGGRAAGGAGAGPAQQFPLELLPAVVGRGVCVSGHRCAPGCRGGGPRGRPGGRFRPARPVRRRSARRRSRRGRSPRRVLRGGPR